jgi:hypothetical protein
MRLLPLGTGFGDPNEPGLPSWPIYDPAKPRYLDFGDPIRASDALGSEACDVFDETLGAR